MTERQLWEEIQFSFVRNLVEKGIDYAIQEVETTISDLSKLIWFKRITKTLKHKKYLDQLNSIKSDFESYRNGRSNGESKGLAVLDHGSIKNGISIVGHVPDFDVWRKELFSPQFPNSVDLAIAAQATSWVYRFIGTGGTEPVDTLIKDMHDAATRVVHPIFAKGYLAWNIHEKALDENAILNEITRLFTASGNGAYTLLAGLPLWHVGYIDYSLKVRYGRPLWATDNINKIGSYTRQSVQDKGEARRLHLHLVKHTAVADFYLINLQPMQLRFSLDHSELAYFLKEWGLLNGLGGITGTNGGWDEVVLFKPEHQLEASLVEDLLTNHSTHFNPPKALSI